MANNIGYTFGSKPDYTVGNIVLTAGSKNFTVTNGANLQAANILSGYTIFHPNGKILAIDTITNATSGTLRYNCPSDCGGTIATMIRYQAEGSSLSAAVRDLISSQNSGLLYSLSSLSMTEGKMIVGDATAGTVKAVTLNSDNVPQGTTNQYVTQAQKTKLDNIFTTANTWTQTQKFNAPIETYASNPMQFYDTGNNKVWYRFVNNIFYMLLGGPSDTTWNSLRPFMINGSNGNVEIGNGLLVKNGLRSDTATITSTLSVAGASTFSGSVIAANATVSGTLNASAANLTNLNIAQIAFYPSINAPSGWLKANGALVSRATYPLLWAFAQASGALVSEADWNNGNQGCFSVGNGSTTFRLPEMRGEFLRGLDDGRGIDTSRTIGSAQGDAIRNIVGRFSAYGYGDGQGTGAMTSWVSAANAIAGGSADNQNFNIYEFSAARYVPTAAENRPRNIALLACVRYQ